MFFCKIEGVLLYSQSTPWKLTTRDFKVGQSLFIDSHAQVLGETIEVTIKTGRDIKQLTTSL